MPDHGMDGKEGRESLGALRALGWLTAAAWWAFKSPTGWLALVASAGPWFVLAWLNTPSHGFSVALAMGLYGQLSLWSAMCAGSHFMGRPFAFEASAKAWGSLASGRARSLSLCFAACAVAGLAWTQLCFSLTGLADLLEAVSNAKGQEQARAMLMAAWQKQGWDGLAMPLALWQLGLGAINGFWCLMPWRALSHPELKAGERLSLAWLCARRAPWPLWILGLVGVLIAQIGLVVPPLALLAGPWMLACAFAARDLGMDPAPHPL